MARSYKIVSVRVSVGHGLAYLIGAARDGFHGRSNTEANVSGWLQHLAAQRLQFLQIDPEDPPNRPPEGPPPKPTGRARKRVQAPEPTLRPPPAVERIRPTPTHVDVLRPPEPIAPSCWHVQVGQPCPRCGRVRMR